MGNHKRRAWVLIGIFALVAAGFYAFSGDEDSSGADPSNDAPSLAEDQAECPESWLIVISNKEDNRWFADGLQEIREAETPEEARNAANTWLSLVRRDPQLLAGSASYFLAGRQVDPASLVDADRKCATQAAVMLAAEIELSIADGEVTAEPAPADGTNSGTTGDGDVVSSETAGISGDRTAVKVVLKDGTTIWIMARCGNPVVKGPAPVPPGPTDEPPPVPPTEPPSDGSHPSLSFDCMQNGINCPPGVVNDVVQPPQDNDTSGVDTGPTPGAPSVPHTPPPGPTPTPGTPAPPSNNGGYDSGSGDGSGTPGGSTCNSSGCDGGGPTGPAPGPPPTVDDGTHGGMPGDPP